MCFSAPVSYTAAAVLVTTGGYALFSARGLANGYRLLALTPIFFGIQQGFEGWVWQAVSAGEVAGVLTSALGFHFFSHFLWLWWFPLASYLLEPQIVRRRLFLGLGMLGALTGGVVYFAVLSHPDWLHVSIRHHSLVYDILAPYRGPVRIPVPASAVYALIVLVPLFGSSHRQLRIFGVLVVASVVLASLFYGYAFVSVWCFFVAVLSLYLAVLVRRQHTALVVR